MKLKNIFLISLASLLLSTFIIAQANEYPFDASPEHPFGLPNPEAPEQLLDWAPLIGECNCKSISRKKDQTWADTVDMIWRFKYILNGFAVQDETLKSDGVSSGSIRQFNPDSSSWFVHYFSSNSAPSVLPAWEGNKRADGKIISYKDHTASNGMAGNYKITFFDIDENGYNWLGEWVTKDESVSYPTWKIYCKRKKNESDEREREQIIATANKFSKAYMDADFTKLSSIYSEDGKIFPPKSAMIEGREAIKKRWQYGAGSDILFHKVNPTAIHILSDTAYDYGTYEGKTKKLDNSVQEWAGKYLVVWKKVNGEWKMFLDMWNQSE